MTHRMGHPDREPDWGYDDARDDEPHADEPEPGEDHWEDVSDSDDEPVWSRKQIMAGVAVGAVVILGSTFFISKAMMDDDNEGVQLGEKGPTNQTVVVPPPESSDADGGARGPMDSARPNQQRRDQPTTQRSSSSKPGPSDPEPGEDAPAPPDNYVEPGQAGQQVEEAATIIRDMMVDRPPNDLAGYDALADALEPLGLTPDESVYTAFENLGYVGMQSSEVLVQSAGADPQIFDNGDGSYTLSYPVVATMMTRESMNNAGWSNHQRDLYKKLKSQLDNNENVYRLRYRVDPGAGTVSVANTTWWS